VTPGTTAADLARAFDGAFALPPRDAAPDWEDLLAVRVDDEPYALRVAELGGVATERRITAVPSSNPALLGLVGLRGIIVPVFDLARLLAGSSARTPPRWVARTRDVEPLGFGFGSLEGHLRVARAELGQGSGDSISALLRSDSGLRPVIDLTEIARRVRGHAAEHSRQGTR
jgi:chemotaxis signal transduction protein